MINPNIPLVELHRHLDGNIHPETIWDLAQKHGIALPASSLDELVPMTQIIEQTSDLMAFLEKLEYGVSVLADLQACRRVAFENLRDAKAQGIDYIELRFSPYYMAKAHNLDMAGVVEAVIDGVQAGIQQYGVQAKLIGILSRTFGADICMQELQALLAHKDSIVALDLAGDELNFPAPMFVEHFNKGRDAGWQITVHAGEADGPESIWNAIKLLGATRIGHAIAATRDPELMSYMAKNRIAVESCPTSNFHTSTVKELEKHPLPLFLENEILVSISTDDPAVSNIDLPHEYEVAHKVLGMTAEQLSRLQENAIKSAFMTESERQALWNKKG
ncbi:adenosine deaminase [Paraneptunicella aestuarii]|uniref:adenosine deaminase n=1 Tax=Paraneptunicella aestuarii TaxID=2831148 RepID=UPI001E3BE988|nr:adenosine deaminase [Paraneptunicella aestuarii]UAA40560.1 adenosine deaminase [Paraneptunicella aestuarii]